MEEQINFKVVLIGESSVGKTCIIQRYAHNIFNSFQISTVGTNSFYKIIKINNEIKVTFELWDTAGQEKFRSLGKIFYNDADVCIFVYDITNKTSFGQIKNYWIKEVKTNIQENASKIFYNLFSFCFGWK